MKSRRARRKQRQHRRRMRVLDVQRVAAAVAQALALPGPGWRKKMLVDAAGAYRVVREWIPYTQDPFSRVGELLSNRRWP